MFKAVVLRDYCFVFLPAMVIILRPRESHIDEGIMLVWTHWSWSLSFSLVFLSPLSAPLQVSVLGLAWQGVRVYGCVRVYLSLLCVGGWSSTAVSRQPYLQQRDTGQRGPLCLTLWKLTGLCWCVCLRVLSEYMCMQTMPATALFHKCILISCCIPQGVLCSKAHCLLIAQVNCTFDLRFKSHVF